LSPPGEIPLRAFIRPIFNRNGARTYPEAETPVRVITRVPESLRGRADEASLRDFPKRRLTEKAGKGRGIKIVDSPFGFGRMRGEGLTFQKGLIK
jgi:hypothetical protein